LHGGGGRGGRGEAASGGGCSEVSAFAVLEDLHIKKTVVPLELRPNEAQFIDAVPDLLN
jgi:hypothetical protein